KRFPRITSSAFEHPADTAALEAVKRIPILDKVFKKFLELGMERVFRIQLMGQAIHVTPKQCHKIHGLFKEAADILDLQEPDLFLATNPYVNAFTFGVERPFIVLQSGLVDLLDEEELMAVLGHELGHVKCGHVLYRSIAYFLAHIASRVLGLGGLATMGLAVALFEWSRKSELSADRAELLVVQDAAVCLSTHMKLSAGSKAVFAQINAEEFLRQAETYEDLDHSTLNKVYKFLQELWLDHPIPVFRAREIKNWSESRQYKEIMAGRYPTKETSVELRNCPHCNSKISPSFFFCPDCGKNARV
ncbi:MAG: M48 family metalloprotease, partial [Candidatus Melainabacteria bacterium]|nr:M48 family metalloprotease [Candidatus Melainabacteria bacterium]